GVVSTLAAEPAGTPSASLAGVELDDDGAAVLLLTTGAAGRDLEAGGRAALLVAEPLGDPDPLAAGQVVLLGRAEPAGAGDAGRSRWRLHVEAVRWVGPDGAEAAIDPAEWAAARPDPVAPFAAPIVEHLNDDHADSCLLLVQALAG